MSARRIRVGNQEAVTCACKGWLYATTADDASKVQAVVEHRLTPQHQGWDAEAWREANTAPDTVAVVVKRIA